MARARNIYTRGRKQPGSKRKFCDCGREAFITRNRLWICERCARIEAEITDRGGPTHHNPMAKYFAVYSAALS